jgi:dTDP-4-dehydrorhamnose 3,5-epimerase
MHLVTTSLPGFLAIEPTVHRDERGFFQETYRASALADAGLVNDWVQDNHARSARGVLRGMHFSVDPGQVKLVRCARGRVLDVVVDVRRGSPTFGRWDALELDDQSCRQAYVPLGFAHGYYVLSEVADVVYKCSAYYDGSKERGIRFDDPTVGIEWPAGERVVSGRDAEAPLLAEIAAELPFVYTG